MRRRFNLRVKARFKGRGVRGARVVRSAAVALRSKGGERGSAGGRRWS
jgi:hypothetical protein